MEALSRPPFDTLGCLAEVMSGSAHTDEEWGIHFGDFERALSDTQRLLWIQPGSANEGVREIRLSFPQIELVKHTERNRTKIEVTSNF